MENSFDAIVVGAGNGGLMAALDLQANGHKVLLIEKQNLPGGVATSFRRGRFEFDVSLHELCSVGSEENPGDIRRTLDSYGVKLNYVMVPELFRVIGTYRDGSLMDVTVPHGREEFKKAIVEQVSDAEEAIDKMYQLFDDFTTATNLKKGCAKAAISGINYAGTSTIEVLEKIGMPPKAIDILTTYWAYLGVPLKELVFAHFYAMVGSYILYGGYIIKNTSYELSMSLFNRFRELGGKTLLGTKCDKILTEDKRVYGIIANGNMYYANQVIFNGNPTICYRYLLDYKPTKHEEALLRARKFSSRPFVVYLGLNKTVEELGLKDYCIFLPEYKSAEEEYESMKEIDTNKYIISVCPSVAEKNYSPSGTSILVLTSIYSRNCWGEVKEEDYYNTKEDKALEMIKIFEKKTNTKILDAIEEISISTPWTYHRYVGTPQGAGYGYELEAWDNILARFLHSNKDCKIKGLNFCGGASILGNGYNVSMLSGIFASLGAKKKMKGNK